MRFTIIAALIMLVISGCRTTDPPRTLFTQTADRSYDFGSIEWASGESTHIFYKTLEHNGFVSFCAYAVSAEGMNSDTEARMLDQRTLSLDDVPLGSSDFIPVYETNVSRSATAHCIQTSIAWEKSWGSAAPYLDGPKRVRSLD